jgi:osmotically-inducible protein OsmY
MTRKNVFASILNHKLGKGGIKMRYVAFAGFCCVLAAGCNEASKPERTDVTVRKPVGHEAQPLQTDNTGVNVRDRDHATKTPVDQNENRKDLQLTADIRKRIMDSKLSIDAQNVKVITQEGKVTLRGPVKTADEKEQIERIAKDVAGAAGEVDNQLEVKSHN